MNPEIRFENLLVQMGSLGEETSVPDLVGGLILQNNLEFHLDADDEIYGGYGRCRNSYPYRQLSGYSRGLEVRPVKTAVLENDYLKAVFLPELGGRLWTLWDKEQKKNLLYTNDVIRFSNLAVRNAWFSGGVEWNIGVIGHSPFTTAPMFTAVLSDEQETPVLRMYEYERIRQVTYQMDFWLGSKDRFLNARMRIVNIGDETVPMYWWSNIAVPEYEQGRLLVPAEKAYTFRDGGVYKVDIPVVDGVDITQYENIPVSVDYFFDIPEKAPKYIANVDKDGYGLLQMSTGRLQSRKLFSWGKKRAGSHWQEFLTEKAGKYVEIQAGLAKTQYGCLPMAPHTAWEWLERYGAVQLKAEEMAEPFEALRDKFTGVICDKTEWQEMEHVLSETKELATKEADVFQQGSGYGALKNKERKCEGKSCISGHLDFETEPGKQKLWVDFLETGILEEPDPTCEPPCFMTDELFFSALKESIKGEGRNNWFAHYQLGIYYFQKENFAEAEKEFQESLSLRENPWSYHGIASVYTISGKRGMAKEALEHGIRMRKKDISYVKDGLRMLDMNEGFQEIFELYQELDKAEQEDSRIKFYYIKALSETGQSEKAYELLCSNGGLVVDDIREGEVSIGELWQKLHRELHGEEGKLPYIFDFIAL